MSKIHISKKVLPLLFCIPIFLFISVVLFFSGKDTRQFNDLTETLFVEEMTGNTLNLHYTLAIPENFGITDYTPILPCYSPDSQAASTESLTDYLTQLSDIDIDRLDEESRYTYTLLTRYLTQVKEGKDFLYYEEPLSPSSGMQSQLPILLAEYTFRSVRDVEDYLSLLDQTDEYFAGLLLYEKEKKAAGLLLSDDSLEKVCDQCYTILSKTELEAGTHFLQTTFSERLEALKSQWLISEAEAESYFAQNDRLLKTVMQPAYEALSDGLFLLMEDGTSTPVGLSAFPLGKEYYTWLVRKNTGSALSPDEIKTLLYPQFQQVYNEFRSLLLSREDGVGVWLTIADDASFPLRTPEEIMTDLQGRMTELFPSFPVDGLAATLPALSVKTVSASLEDYCAPAFYLTPPMDDTDNNVIYVNEKSTPQGLELYTTLAHEGYPGHLYQTVYSQRFMDTLDANPVRQILWYGGYQEGWAIYVEFIAYDYAAALATERGDADAAYAYTLEKHNRNMQLCLYAILDVAIHYDNIPYEQIHKILTSFGVSDPATTRRVYDYIAEEPANYLKYYLGYLEILRLQDAARIKWGDAYSDLRFHTFYLEHGPADFTTLGEALSASAVHP